VRVINPSPQSNTNCHGYPGGNPGLGVNRRGVEDETPRPMKDERSQIVWLKYYRIPEYP